MAGFESEQRAPLRVMVVDAHTDAADSAAILLRLWDFEVRTAYSSAQALAEARTYRPDVLLTEIALPNADGYALARQIREHAGNHPLACIAVTGLGRAADRQRSHAEAFAYHLVKPFDPCQLKDILRALAGTRRPLPAQEASGNSKGARLPATPSQGHAARTWRSDYACLLRSVDGTSKMLRAQSRWLLEKSRALRRRNPGLYLHKDAEGEMAECPVR